MLRCGILPWDLKRVRDLQEGLGPDKQEKAVMNTLGRHRMSETISDEEPVTVTVLQQDQLLQIAFYSPGHTFESLPGKNVTCLLQLAPTAGSMF